MDNITKNIKKKKRDINTLILTTDKSDLDEYLELSRVILNKRVDLNKVVLNRIENILLNMNLSDNSEENIDREYVGRLLRCERKTINYAQHIIRIEFGDRFGDIFYELEVTSDILWSDDFKVQRINHF